MYQTIYFQKLVWERFKDEDNKSALINDLLADYYKVAKIAVIKETPVLINTNDQAKEAVRQLKEGKEVKKIQMNICPNGHILQAGRNKCSTKGCKYGV